MNEAPIFPRTYDLLCWLLPATLKYPREHRYALARKTRHKHDLLTQADVKLEQVRLYLRLARDLNLLSVRQYEHVTRLAGEVGALLGHWMKRSGSSQTSVTPAHSTDGTSR